MSDNQASLPVGWQRRALADLGDWSGGQTPFKSNPHYWQNGNILWVSPKDITGPLIVDSEDKITSLALANTRLRLYPIKSIMVVVRSGILRHRLPVTRCTKPFTVNQDLKVLIPNEDVDPQFIFCMLNQLGPTILSRVVKAGTTVESVDIPVFLNLEIPTPPRQQQRKIARILTTVDNLIEKTENLIAKYQAIKQGMMLDLFTRGVDTHGHLRPTPAEAPDIYKQSELGWIPREWDCLALGVVVPKAEYGISVSLDDPEGVPVLRMNNLGQGKVDVTDIKRSNYPEAGRLLLKENDVLFNRTNSIEHVGRTSIWRNELPEASFASYLVRLVPDMSRMLPDYLVYWMNRPETQIAIRQFATPGVHQVNINPTNLRKSLICVPTSLKEQSHISLVIAKHEKRLYLERVYLDNLMQQKIGLMQDLLTGKVRVEVDEEDTAIHA